MRFVRGMPAQIELWLLCLMLERLNKINNRIKKHRTNIRDAVVTQAVWQGTKQIGKEAGNYQSDECGCEK